MPELPPRIFTRAEAIGMGRCPDCGWHEPTQGHHEACPIMQPEGQHQ